MSAGLKQRVQSKVAPILRIEDDDINQFEKIDKDVKIGQLQDLQQKFMSEIILRAYGENQEYKRKDQGRAKDIMYKVIQSVKGEKRFKDLEMDKFLNIESILFGLLQHEKGVANKLIEHRTYITHCFVKHEQEYQNILQELNKQKVLMQSKQQKKSWVNSDSNENEDETTEKDHGVQDQHQVQSEVIGSSYKFRKIKQNCVLLKDQVNELASGACQYLQIQRQYTQSKFDKKLQEIAMKIDKEFKRSKSGRNKYGWIGPIEERKQMYQTVESVSEKIDQKNQDILKNNQQLQCSSQICTSDLKIIKQQLSLAKQKQSKLLDKLEKVKQLCEIKKQKVTGEEQVQPKVRARPKSMMSACGTNDTNQKQIKRLEEELIEVKNEKRQWVQKTLDKQMFSQNKIQLVKQLEQDLQQQILKYQNTSKQSKVQKKLEQIELLEQKLQEPFIKFEQPLFKQRPLTSRAGQIQSSSRKYFFDQI